MYRIKNTVLGLSILAGVFFIPLAMSANETQMASQVGAPQEEQDIAWHRNYYWGRPYYYGPGYYNNYSPYWYYPRSGVYFYWR